MSGPVILAAGGTGGHLFPAIALGQELMRRGHAIAAVTDQRGGELAERLEGVPVHRLRASAMSGRSLKGKITGAVDLLLGTLDARRLLKTMSPSAVVGFGGYPTVPPLLAAQRLGISTIIHEQNAVLGRANKLLAHKVDLVVTSFEHTRGVGDRKVLLCGNPVRAEVATLFDQPYRPPNGDGRLRVLVFGGSQGARVLSEILPAALAKLPSGARQRLVMTQQCRSEDIDRVRAAYDDMGVVLEVATFFDDMAARLGQAQLVICRAGASSIAELAVSGRPSILVPYPHATDDHQTANARAVEEAGAGWLMHELAFTPDALAARLEAFVACPAALVDAANAARRSARADATHRLAEAVESYLGSNGTSHTGFREAAA
jgi:UDP-N-acetylglucosamine--N-acetylmuramyl-(pentapeptide) pyrophosphoryl-undecaprenol N-acetylglucosamine transferase